MNLAVQQIALGTSVRRKLGGQMVHLDGYHGQFAKPEFGWRSWELLLEA